MRSETLEELHRHEWAYCMIARIAKSFFSLVLWLLVTIATLISPRTFAYDGQSEAKATYDERSSLPVLAYDPTTMLTAQSGETRGVSRSDFFADFAKFLAAEGVTTPIGELRAAGLQDAHHVIQDAAVRDLPGYDTQLAPGVQLEGPSTSVGTPHYLATQAQRAAGGGTYAAERDIAANSLRAAGYSEAQIQQALSEADNYFQSIGVNSTAPTRIPGNRRP